jgi:hypothetical protein
MTGAPHLPTDEAELMNDDRKPPVIDTTTAHPARRYDYWLGGKDNFAVDRESGDAVAKVFPGIRTAVIQNREFLKRAVRYLVEEKGIRQFLDVGTGLPTANNTHEVAQRVAPDSRIVYVDNDPLVLVHARALLTSSDEGATAYLDADLRQPEQILTSPDLKATMDLSKPVAVLLVAVLHFLPSDEQVATIVRTLMQPLAPGSFLVISHASLDKLEPGTAGQLTNDNIPGFGDFTARSREQILPLFDGLTLVPPGLEVVSNWRPEPGSTPPPADQVSTYGAVARKPAPTPRQHDGQAQPVP